MKTPVVATALAALALSSAACTPDKALEAANTGTTRPAAVDAGADSGAAEATALPALPKMEFAENDFAESDRNRDPFRTYVSVIGPEVKKVANVQKEVILPQFSLDELKLVAIVTGGEYPRAMVVDPAGKGWVIKRGDWVGRPEVVHIGGANGTDYQINWRVNKVRDGDIVFTREDPAQPGIPPASRVIALRTESEQPRDRL
ncbi:MAG: pilus assembly protein PilP [Labilithrix sp.]|nr:pilus assembly protein PilP [Labilithrix sp.]MCW5832652.1 pilus assembly protein PilP [Labilithrix sp.]